MTSCGRVTICEPTLTRGLPTLAGRLLPAQAVMGVGTWNRGNRCPSMSTSCHSIRKRVGLVGPTEVCWTGRVQRDATLPPLVIGGRARREGDRWSNLYTLAPGTVRPVAHAL